MSARSRLAVAAGAVALALLPLACDEGTPLSPEGAILRVTASPSRIAKEGEATITVEALRSNGIPVNTGTQIRLSATLGNVDAIATTNSGGIAIASLHGDGRVGTSTVTASSGANEPVSVDVAVGSLASSIRLQVAPASVPQTGGFLSLLALIRDDQGQPLPDATVNFTADVGTLASGGIFLVSDANGEARDELSVTEAELLAVGGDAFDVTAEVGAEGGVQSDTFVVSIQRPPRASFTFQRVDNQVAFTDTSTGGPTQWTWSFGDGNSSTQQNPVHVYAGSGSFIVQLTVNNAVGEDTANATVVIP